jgi:hypothetical protein
MLPDYLDDAVSVEVLQPRQQKVVLVQALELAIIE